MSDGVFTTADGCRLAYEVAGDGQAVLWQHGLGADRAQPAEVFPALSGIRRITLECRGHGRSALGDPDALSIAQFADDARALLDHLTIRRAVVGGISLGAAIALRLAALRPERVSGLVVGRPAWLDAPAPETLRVYAQVASLMAAHGIEEARRRFEASPLLAEMEAASPDNAASLRSFFDRPDPRSTIALLGRIPLDGPGVSRAMLAHLAVPTLIVAHGRDYVHPLATARALAAIIPAAELVEITPKSTDRAGYVAGFRAALARFLGAGR